MQGSNQEKKRVDGLDLRWRVMTAAGVEFACRVYAVGPRVEVRLTTTEDRLVCARVVSSLDAAGKVVSGWLRAVVSNEDLGALFSASRDVVH